MAQICTNPKKKRVLFSPLCSFGTLETFGCGEQSRCCKCAWFEADLAFLLWMFTVFMYSSQTVQVWPFNFSTSAEEKHDRVSYLDNPTESFFKESQKRVAISWTPQNMTLTLVSAPTGGRNVSEVTTNHVRKTGRLTYSKVIFWILPFIFYFNFLWLIGGA